MGLESIAIAKRTVSIRRNKNPAYKKPFLPQRWDNKRVAACTVCDALPMPESIRMVAVPR